MDDTGFDPVQRQQRNVGMWTWLLIAFNALLVIVVVVLFIINRNKPADSQPDPNPKPRGSSSQNENAAPHKPASNGAKTAGNGTGNGAGRIANTTNTAGNGTGANQLALAPAGDQGGDANLARAAYNDRLPALKPGAAGTSTSVTANSPPSAIDPDLAKVNAMNALLAQARAKVDAGDAEACLKLLTQVRDNYPDKWHPPDLQERITELGAEVNRSRVAEADKARFEQMRQQLKQAGDLWARKQLPGALKLLTDVRDGYPREWQPENLAGEIARLTKQIEARKDASFFGQKVE